MKIPLTLYLKALSLGMILPELLINLDLVRKVHHNITQTYCKIIILCFQFYDPFHLRFVLSTFFFYNYMLIHSKQSKYIYRAFTTLVTFYFLTKWQRNLYYKQYFTISYATMSTHKNNLQLFGALSKYKLSCLLK